MAHWQDAQQVSYFNSALYFQAVKAEKQALEASTVAATKHFKKNYKGRSLNTLPFELLNKIASNLVETRETGGTKFSLDVKIPLQTKRKRLRSVCCFRMLCRRTAAVGQAVIMKIISEDDERSGDAGGILALPSKQPLDELTSVFSNAGFASLIKGITIFAQPYITSHRNDLRFKLYDILRQSKDEEVSYYADKFAGLVVGAFEAQNAEQQIFTLELMTNFGFQHLRSLIYRVRHVKNITFRCHDYWQGYRFFFKESICPLGNGELEANHWLCIRYLWEAISHCEGCKLTSLYLDGDTSLISAFGFPEDEPLLRDVTGHLKSITLGMTWHDLMATEPLKVVDYIEYMNECTALSRGSIWQRCLAGAPLLEELVVKRSELADGYSHYLDQVWLNTVIFGQSFPLLRRFVLDGAIIKTSELETFMLRHAGTLQEIVVNETTCHAAYEGLTHMIDVMREQLTLKQCMIKMHHRQRLGEYPDDEPQSLQDILSLYIPVTGKRAGETPDLSWIDLGLYVMRQETRGSWPSSDSDDESEDSRSDEEEEGEEDGETDEEGDEYEEEDEDEGDDREEDWEDEDSDDDYLGDNDYLEDGDYPDNEVAFRRAVRRINAKC